MTLNPNESLDTAGGDPLIRRLNQLIVFVVRVLAVLMILVIFWGLCDVLVHLYNQMSDTYINAFNSDNLIYMLGSFLAVLIAIEIFLNIIFYLKKDAIHVPLVLSTALTAIARKVIIMDYSSANPNELAATAVLILSVGVTYWLVTKKSV